MGAITSRARAPGAPADNKALALNDSEYLPVNRPFSSLIACVVKNECVNIVLSPCFYVSLRSVNIAILPGLILSMLFTESVARQL